MRFFNRTDETASLREIRRMSKDNAQFTVVTGRRRIGKTYLVWKAYEDEPILYFFVARKAEGDLCEDYRTGGAFCRCIRVPDETFHRASHHAVH